MHMYVQDGGMEGQGHGAMGRAAVMLLSAIAPHRLLKLERTFEMALRTKSVHPVQKEAQLNCGRNTSPPKPPLHPYCQVLLAQPEAKSAVPTHTSQN